MFLFSFNPSLRTAVAAVAAFAISSNALAQKKYDPGASDTEIKIGNFVPYSGPVSAYGTIGKAAGAYFEKINDEGGVSGRKIKYISVDDEYNPAKSVEQARKLVERDQVLLLFLPLGTAHNAAIQKYMNTKKVPQLFVGSGGTRWGDPKAFPWTMGWQPTYQAEGQAYAKHILATKPGAKIAILNQNDDFGRDFLKGVMDTLGDKAKTMIVAQATYETSDPTIDSQVVSLKESGADVLINLSTPKFAAQAIKKVAQIEWKPTHYIASVSFSVSSVFQPAGPENAVGIISSTYMRDPSEPRWQSTPEYADYQAVMKKYYSAGNVNDSLNVIGYSSAQTLVQVLKQCGDNLTRENVMKEAANLNMTLPMLYPGIEVKTSPDDFYPVEKLQLMRFQRQELRTDLTKRFRSAAETDTNRIRYVPGIHALSHPDRPAIIMTGSGETVTYAELADRSLRLANWLHDAGLRRGDVVGLLSDNNPRVFDVYWATQRSGLYLMSINYRLSAGEIDYMLENSGAAALFVGRGGIEVAASLAQHPLLKRRVCIAGELPGYENYEQVVASARSTLPPSQPRGGDMLYSSGTTGRPKGVKQPLPARDVADQGDTMVEMFSSHFGFDADTVYLSPAPLYHAAPLRTCASVHALGGTALVMERFDAEAALAAIENFRVTHSQWVPTMFVRMLKLPTEVRERYDINSSRVVIHAAAPCPIEVKQKMMDWFGPKLFEFYSCTEVNGMTAIGPEEWLAKPGSVGRAVLGKIHICDDDGTELKPGQTGAVYFERDVMPFVYHNEPEKTRAAQHPVHPTWTTVGDVGHIDEDGFLYLTDRKSFMIISGGVNIYPQEIENELALHPAIADVAVIGVPDPDMGEQVKAVVQLTPGLEGSDAVAKQIMDFVRNRLAGYKVPKSVDFVDLLPRSPAGKLLKQEIRKRYWPA